MYVYCRSLVLGNACLHMGDSKDVCLYKGHELETKGGRHITKKTAAIICSFCIGVCCVCVRLSDTGGHLLWNDIRSEI